MTDNSNSSADVDDKIRVANILFNFVECYDVKNSFLCH